MASIKMTVKKLDKIEPWTKRELQGLDAKTRQHIRNIQINNNMKKDEAKEVFANANLKGKAKAFNLKQRKLIEQRSETGGAIQTETEFKKPLKVKEKREKKISIAQKKKVTGWKKTEKKKLSDYLHSVKNFNSSKFRTIKKNHLIYRDATLYELQHGINSKASRTYRMRHGLSAEYSGKVKV